MPNEGSAPRLGRREWLEAAFNALTEGSVDAVRVEPLARRLGVTKGSFYWHFESRQDLLDELLAAYERVGTEAVIEQADAASDDPRQRLRSLSDLVFGASDVGSRAEPALRAWAATDANVAEVLGRVDARRLDYVTGLLVAAGSSPEVARHRANAFYRLLIGEFVWISHGGAPLEAAARREVTELLLGDTGNSPTDPSHSSPAQGPTEA